MKKCKQIVRVREAKREARKLKVCYKHPKPIEFDGGQCPACAMLCESPHLRVTVFKGW